MARPQGPSRASRGFFQLVVPSIPPQEGQEPQALRLEVDTPALFYDVLGPLLGLPKAGEAQPPHRPEESMPGESIVELRAGTGNATESVAVARLRPRAGIVHPMPPGGGFIDEDEDCEPGMGCWDSEGGLSTHDGSGVPFVGVGVVLTVFTGIFIYNLIRDLTKGVVVLAPNEFPNVKDVQGADSGDVIELSDVPGTPGMLTVTMALGPNVGDWKAAEIYDKNGKRIGLAAVHRAVGNLTESTSVTAADASFIRLMKAKLFGVHTVMYVINNVALHWEGRDVTFTWMSD
jgi:hypothetical protein